MTDPLAPSPHATGDSGGPAGGPCVLCGGVGSECLFTTRDHLSGESFQILRCPACCLVRTGGSLDPEAEASFYGASYYGAAGRRFPRPMEALVARFRRHRARMVRRLHPRPGAILDVGCGRALMLSHLRDEGWSCVGVERSSELAEVARERLHLDVRMGETALAGLESDSFDVATLWHVLEHLHAPLAALEEIHRVLRPGGYLLVEVPNLDSLQARIGAGGWFHLDAPRHRFHFTPVSLKALLTRAGFHVEDEGCRSWEYGPFGMAQTLLNRIAPYPNILFGLLQGQGAAMSSRAGKGWVAVSVLLALPALAAGLALESAAILAGRGGVVRMRARP